MTVRNRENAVSPAMWDAFWIRLMSDQASMNGLRLDCVDRSVGERAHRAGYQAQDHRLVAWKLAGFLEGRLVLESPFFELLVCGEVDTYDQCTP